MAVCDVCGKDKESTRWRACAYDVDIHGADPDEETEFVCDECEDAHSDDI
jgi:hypothetical protein